MQKKILPRGPKAASFPIVGVGASAGGLEASQELLKNLSEKPGMAFVFIMHLAPEHKSMLTQLLARETKMPVIEIKNGMPIEINYVYIIPPAANVSIASGKLILSNRRDKSFKHMPIDFFFRSLAEEQGNRGIGVILSGTATDGTLGAEVIKAEGGIIFAQDEKSAKYDGMPQSAISAGCVDYVLSPRKIAGELECIAKHPHISPVQIVKTDESTIAKDKGLESIFDILHCVKGLDFTYYKTATISRRISRQMILTKLENLKAYIKFLRENKTEVEKLYEDLLINVTSFFRDEKVFHTLEKLVIPKILKNKTKGQGIRIWVPGCSSGEESYSIAICFAEAMKKKTSTIPIQIFATDISESGINKARRGVYGKSIKDCVTPERLKKFFTKEGNSYKVSRGLREMCIFSKQNVFSDPPFSNIDLISCRNLLIYFQPVLQKKVFQRFHYGLRPGGFLLLGNSESVGGYSDFFKALDRKQRIFVKKYLPVLPEIELTRPYQSSKEIEIKEEGNIKKARETDIAGIADRVVLNEYAPCGVLIDSNMRVVQFRGHTGRYLESAVGRPSLDIFKLAREGLLLQMRTAICKARETRRTIKREAENVKCNGRKIRVNITVIPVSCLPAGRESAALKEELFLVLFDEIKRAAGFKNLPRPCGKISLREKSVKSDEYINNLQKELAETKEYLQTVIEEQERSNEEVKTANEEILSSNEELQSTNEELETAKEELQSSNEELMTSNEELQNRNAESSLLNNDLANLLISINMPVVMMGTDLVVRRITAQAEKSLNIGSSDIGRPISKIKLNVDIPDFEKMLLDVIESLHPKTFEIKGKEGIWYSVYLRPYRTIDNKIGGVVAIFVDVTELKQAQMELERVKEEEHKKLVTRLEELSLKDTHTGLHNYRYLMERLESEVKTARRYVLHLSVVMLDIDYFKSINDVYGHQYGDEILKEFAQCLKDFARTVDIVTRYGGEEFVIALPDTNKSGAIVFSERLLDVISKHLFDPQGRKIKLKISIGISSFPEDGNDIGTASGLINSADKALLKAKENGGNCLSVFKDTGKDIENILEKGGRENVYELRKKLSKMAERVDQALLESIYAFAKTVSAKDYYTGEHAENMVSIVVKIGKEFHLTSEVIKNLSQAAILHDLGKVGVPDYILHKKEKLTKEEYEIIKKHPQIGAEIIRSVHFLDKVAPIILYHHERFDGLGYSAGLKGREIPQGARIIAIADAYQALISDRPYRKAYGEKEALDIIEAGSGTQFDPEIVKKFLATRRSQNITES